MGLQDEAGQGQGADGDRLEPGERGGERDGGSGFGGYGCEGLGSDCGGE